MHFQWLRAAVLGASDDLVSTASLMLGIGAACPADEHAVLLSGLAGLVAVAWPSASRPPVRANRPRRRPRAARCLAGRNRARGPAPASAPAGLRLQAAAVSPSSQATAASTLSFAAGAMFPLLAAWFVASYASRRLLPPQSSAPAAPPGRSPATVTASSFSRRRRRPEQRRPFSFSSPTTPTCSSERGLFWSVEVWKMVKIF
ncbi:Os01g0280300 [Oryza sativa Japonica Group]|nr:Os01g0280300 [Oryza sativa Japonica Group]